MLRRLLSLRAALATYLQALSAGDHPAVLLRCAPDPASPDPAGLVPTLFLIKDALLQASGEDLPGALGELRELLGALGSGDGGDAAQLVRARALGTPGKGAAAGASPAEARTLVVRAAAQRQGDVSRLLFLVEHLLAVLYQHLRACSPGANSGISSAALSALQANGGTARPTLRALGSDKDLDQLRRLTAPAIAAMERLLAECDPPGDRSSLDLLVRRTKELLAAL